MAFAAVVSLKQTIDRILLLPPKSKILIPNSEMKLISDELSYLQSFLEAISPPQSSRSSSTRVNAFERQIKIKDVVHKLEDLIDFHISDQFLSGSEISADDDSSTLAFSHHLLEFRQEITSFTKTFETDEECGINGQNQQQSDDSLDSETAALSRTDYGGKKKKMVGLGKELRKLQGWVLSDVEGCCTMMLIVGMAGIGKTTLVKQVYENPHVMEHFQQRIFVSVGPQYQLKQILLLVLDQLKVDYGEGLSEDSLSELVYKILSGKRYLVVLDDVWNTHISKELERFLPTEVNQSRIIITSRMLDFVDHGRIYGHFVEVPLLNDDESWKLLHDIVFTSNEGPANFQLVKIGKKIAKKCDGLPLAIIEVGKLLLKTEKTVQEWSIIAEQEDPLVIKSDDNTPLSKALLLSYTMLPQYLKVCFLYMSVFPKGYEISRSKLTTLWAAEGFLEPQKGKTLEETADECLRELVSQSVVLRKKLRSVGKRTTKICRLHFTFRNLCVNEAKSESLFRIIKKYVDSFQADIYSQRRLCTHNNIVLGFEQVHTRMESVSGARSLLCFGPKQQYPIRLYLPFRLLKVLDAVSMRFYEFPHQVVELVHLRYFAITFDGEIPASISRLSNLEVLIIHRHHRVIKSSNSPVYLPVEIWKLHKLKHLECMGFDLPDPSPANDDSLILEKLLTVSGVGAHSCTKTILARIPNLTKLGIRIETTTLENHAAAAVETLSFLGGDHFASIYDEFESFKCAIVHPTLVRSQIVPNFPANIKKISLSGCGFPWRNMRSIGELPNLVVLKLRWYAFSGPEWEIEGEFPKLKVLLMEDLDIENWGAEHNHFPALERLIIRHCYKLKEIPLLLTDCGLDTVEVDDCCPSVTRNLQTKQKINRCCYIQIRIQFSGDE